MRSIAGKFGDLSLVELSGKGIVSLMRTSDGERFIVCEERVAHRFPKAFKVRATGGFVDFALPPMFLAFTNDFILQLLRSMRPGASFLDQLAYLYEIEESEMDTILIMEGLK